MSVIDTIASNLVGKDGASVDRIYESIFGKLTLVNSDMSMYKGKIFRKTVIKKDIYGNNFKAPAFLTEDGRWFDRAGLPTSDIVEEDNEDNRREISKDTEEGIQASSETQDEESLQGSDEDDPTVARTEEK